MTYPQLHLRPGIPKRVEGGHPWLYDNEVAKREGTLESGGIVDVYNAKGKFVGRGLGNPKSKILARVFTRNDEPLDEIFFRARIQEAVKLRSVLIDDPAHARVVHAEGDLLPGLVADRFGSTIVTQFLTAGMDARKEMIARLLAEATGASCIYERSDAPVRALEGLPQTVGAIIGEAPAECFAMENGFSYLTDIREGQKTGHFYDQRLNRAALKPFAPGAEVLDCFSYTGGFTIHAAAYGAKSVTTVDVSEDAIARARQNAERNGVAGKCRFVCQNAFDFLSEADDARKAYDLVILDPPAFAKNRGSIDGALRGYKEINLRGMRITRPGGYLATASCSHHIGREAFRMMLTEAAKDARRTLRLIEERTAAPDHPILLSVPETEYLKFLIFQVL